MFSSKQDVDEEVERILKVSNNLYDTEIQCKTISKLYYDIKEFKIAKIYIERFFKVKTDSEYGLILKAKIHQELNEYKNSLRCYENLYNISKRRDYLVKVGECLMQIDVNEVRIKPLIEWLETEKLDWEQLIQIKLRFCSDTESLNKELSKLEQKMINEVDNRYKRQYLLFLEKLPLSDMALSKCIDTMSTFPLLDDHDMVQCCVNIFQKNLPSPVPLFKPLYCILLLSLLKHTSAPSIEKWHGHLSELRDLLVSAYDDPLYKELKSLFLFQIISAAHSSVTCNNIPILDRLNRCFYNAYVNLQNLDLCISNQNLPTVVCDWINQALRCQCSCINHMVYFADESIKEHIDIVSVAQTLGEIIWPMKEEDFTDLKIMFDEQQSSVILDEFLLVEFDVRCHDPVNTDFDLVMWQLLCHFDVFRSQEDSGINISDLSKTYISSLLRTLFPGLQRDISSKMFPDNISQVDLITFLLGAALTYRKSVYKTRYSLPIPFECWKKMKNEICSNTISNWWTVVCHFLWNKKQQPSVDAERKLLQKGLNVVQAIDCGNLTELVKLQIARSLAKYADYSVIKNESVWMRSVSFLYSALATYRSNSSMKIPFKTPFSNQPTANRQIPLNGVDVDFLFETDWVSDEIIEEWRFQAFMCCIDAKLRWTDDFDEIGDLINYAEEMRPNHAPLGLLRSKMYLAFATRICANDDSRWYGHCTALALRSANQCKGKIYSLTMTERLKLESALEEQFEAIDRADCYGAFVPDLMNDIYKSSCCRMEFQPHLLGTVPQTKQSNNGKIYKKINYCIIKSEEVQKDEHEIDLLKSNSEYRDSLYRHLSMEFEKLQKRVQRTSFIEDKFLQCKQKHEWLNWQLKGLTNTIKDLERRNKGLEACISNLENGSGRGAESISAPWVRFHDGIRVELRKFLNTAKCHLKGYDEIEINAIGEYIRLRTAKLNLKQYNNGDCFEHCPSSSSSDVSEASQIEEIDRSTTIDFEGSECVAKFLCNGEFEHDQYTGFFEIDDVENHPRQSPSCSFNVFETDDMKLLEEMVSVLEFKDQDSFKEPYYDKHIIGVVTDKGSNYSSQSPSCLVEDSEINDTKVSDPKISVLEFTDSYSITEPYYNQQHIRISTDKEGNYSRQSPGSTIYEEKLTGKEADLILDLADGYIQVSESDKSDSVIFVMEETCSDEQKERARALMLPDNFYYFENLADNDKTGNSSQESRSMTSVDSPSEHGELFDIPCDDDLIDLPDNEIDLLSDGWMVDYRTNCKLFSSQNHQWLELGAGVMKVFKRIVNGMLSICLLMRREQENTICYEKEVTQSWPVFCPMESSTRTICWTYDHVRSGKICVTETFALRFRSEDALEEFIENVRRLRRKMKEN